MNKKAFKNSSSSRSVSVRDIRLFLFRPILRTATLRNDEAGVKAFTLIELLVVVLIIGILAAIALPQYERAVRKSRVAEARINLKAVIDATDRCILANGNTAHCGWNGLDVEVPTDTKNWHYYIDECSDGGTGIWGCTAFAEPKFETVNYQIVYSSVNYNGGPDSDDWAGKFICRSDNGEDAVAGAKICKALGGVQIDENTADVFVLN